MSSILLKVQVWSLLPFPRAKEVSTSPAILQGVKLERETYLYMYLALFPVSKQAFAKSLDYILLINL